MTDFAQLTDMIDIKMTGMLNMIDKWIPTHSIIKNTLLRDIYQIKQEINVFKEKETSKHTKQFPIYPKPKCRNGNTCWYLQQGRCWFGHEQIIRQKGSLIERLK